MNLCPHCGRAPHLCEQYTAWERALIESLEARNKWRRIDARLTAAAPYLLAALKAIVAEADSHPFNPIGHVIEHVVPHARAAIAKATGEA